MKVLLAGYNVDSQVLEELKTSSPSPENVTPEILSAAYARISRDPRSADKLRAVARSEVERARRSNNTIIFGMGHHSVAEHAVFNFDIIGVSRMAIEEIEKFRLCSFTEKSQRYIKLKDDYILPEEVKKAGREREFSEIVKAQNAFYHKLYRKLQPYFFDKHKALARNPKKHAILNGWAKEDARYVLSLATVGQLGMTANARNLEFLLRRFSSKDLSEIKQLNQRLYDLAKGVAPSIILFTEANDFDVRTAKELEMLAGFPDKVSKSPSEDLVSLVDYTAGGDSRLIAALLHSSSSLSYGQSLHKAKTLSKEKKKEVCLTAFKHMEFFDAVLREFEYVDLTYEMIISAACFAQLKRHRMATLTAQPYNPGLGVTIPPSIREIGAEREFMTVIDRTNTTYTALRQEMEAGAEYILTNSHRKRVLFKVNARELYHISRLREDTTAQWDIRNVARQMSRLAGDAMPLTFLLVGAKDGYPGIYESVFGRPPKAIPPKF